jgi:hypothetical protein
LQIAQQTSISVQGEMVQYKRAMIDSNHTAKVAYFHTPERKKKQGIKLMYHYHEYVGKK